MSRLTVGIANNSGWKRVPESRKASGSSFYIKEQQQRHDEHGELLLFEAKDFLFARSLLGELPYQVDAMKYIA